MTEGIPRDKGDFNLKVLLVLSLGHLATDIYQGALPAILPFLKERLNLTYTGTGVIMLAFNVASSIIQPLFGFISDRRRQTLFLPLGCLCAAGGFCLLPFPSQYLQVLILVVFSGFGVALYHPEGFKTARFFTGPGKAAGMSVFSVGGNLGFALGPVITLAIIQHLGFPYIPIMIIPAATFLIIMARSWGDIVTHKSAAEETKTLRQAHQSSAYISLALIIITVIMRSWTHAGLQTYIPFYYVNYLKGDPIYAGKLVSVFLLGGAIGTLTGSPVADRIGHRLYLILSLLLTTLMFPLILVASGAALFFILFVFGMILISSFTVTIVMAQHLLPGNLGVASGLMVGFAIGTGGIGVTLLGALADRYGVPFALKSIVALPLMGLVTSLFVRYCPEQRPKG